jgi:hypothetical protein
MEYGLVNGKNPVAGILEYGIFFFSFFICEVQGTESILNIPCTLYPINYGRNDRNGLQATLGGR